MTKDEDFKLLKIQTFVLRVNIHCDGCKHKVKKLLKRTEGVFQVVIDAEHQKVAVSGCVDSATLIKKLIRAGKHAELWSAKTNQNQNQNQKKKDGCIKGDKNNKGQKQVAFRGVDTKNHQQELSDLSFSEDNEYIGDEEEERYLNLLMQQAEANNARKMLEAVAAQNKGKMNNQGGKRGNQNQNMVMTTNASGGIDPKLLAAMNNLQFGGGNTGEIRRGGGSNDVNSMMMRNFAGFQGGENNNIAAAPGGIYQVQPTAGIQGGSSSGLNFANYPAYNINNYSPQLNNPAAAAMLMNMQNRQVMLQPQAQPQMMYQRSTVVPPSTTGYYYNNTPGPYTPYNEPVYYAGAAHQSASHIFSDENTSSCSVM
ncbi:hypothetical protein DCAR_0208226 [Daucus carota subsp. sativus]|uniref:Uncharacterized protein n=1 Tax=Daucus carota subsp. sativus TaxID=79200 RepID=A0A161XHD9_DAUCS|nr:PREDICTED: uncharacterized protein LOC108206959 [Daucus carota subsp. sativus]WOG88991.1 hypothetical protein DCAR_0208226 [Daucus carota subsp. sativus]